MPLNDIKCKNIQPKEKSFKIADEKGLYLEVMPNGSKYWRMKYYFAGKEKRLAIGVYPEVSLKEARDKRDAAKKQIQDNLDPSSEKKIRKLQQHINLNNSFENVAREWHEKNCAKWKPRHANYILKRLEADIFSAIGFRPINQITTPELLSAIQTIEKRGALDIAKRALQTCGQIFRYGIITGRLQNDISVALRGAITTRKTVNRAKLYHFHK